MIRLPFLVGGDIATTPFGTITGSSTETTFGLPVRFPEAVNRI
jgi:hypothetical protein